jgi:hypothetical protein
MYCPECAEKSAEGARFCRQCGQDLRLIPQVLAGLQLDSVDPMGWGRIGSMVLSSLVLCGISLAITALGGNWLVPTGMYLAGVTTLAAAATAAYLRLHPSVQIGYRERIKELIFGFAVVSGAGGALLASLVAGLPLVGLVLACLLLVVTTPMLVKGFRIVAAAHREAEESWELEEDDEEEEEPSITDRLTERKAAWQLAPPPSIVPKPLDTARLPQENRPPDTMREI